MGLKLVSLGFICATVALVIAAVAALRGPDTPVRAARTVGGSGVQAPTDGAVAADPRPDVVEADVNGPDEPASGGYLLAIISPETDASSLPSWDHADGRRVRLQQVETMAAAKAIDPSDVGAIAVDGALVDSVDWQWLQAQFTAGKAVVGLNVPIGTLLDRLYPASQPLLGEDGLGWQRGAPNAAGNEGHLYFSALYGPPCRAGVTLKYDDPASQGVFISTLWMMSCGTSVVGFEEVG